MVERKSIKSYVVIGLELFGIQTALGIKEIICQAQDERDKEVLETLGATKVIIPEKIAADRLCVMTITSQMSDSKKCSNAQNILIMLHLIIIQGIIFELNMPKQ